MRFGPLPGEGPYMHYRNPEIYRDMYMRRYVSNVAAWRAYPNEYMGHYYQWFRDAMLPHIPQDRSIIHYVHILRNGQPPKVIQVTPSATIEMTLDVMIKAIMVAEVMDYTEEDAEMDMADHLVNPKENMENPPVIIITNNDNEGDNQPFYRLVISFVTKEI
ncbi:hypothetical protein TIFTF001_023132 [Ficus carica]|uniref:Uncharacterized protein n=1 Tax=Ficus carica TaxID=3494 RepID=A0AA88AWK3_FICCA|nr:hypothetical protein TIFTF001_023132 [Ficus carica]